MPWAKTDAGRLEIQTRSLVQGRPQRNLLLLIDGKKSEEQLLASVAGTSAADIAALRELGLITSPDAAPTPPITINGNLSSSSGNASTNTSTSTGSSNSISADAFAGPRTSQSASPSTGTDLGPAASSSSITGPRLVSTNPAPTQPTSRAPGALPAMVRPFLAPVDIPVDDDPPARLPSTDHVSKALTSIIASELGLRGFTLTLAVERASGIDALLEVAERVLGQVESRKGVAAADKARRAIFGG